MNWKINRLMEITAEEPKRPLPESAVERVAPITNVQHKILTAVDGDIKLLELETWRIKEIIRTGYVGEGAEPAPGGEMIVRNEGVRYGLRMALDAVKQFPGEAKDIIEKLLVDFDDGGEPPAQPEVE